MPVIKTLKDINLFIDGRGYAAKVDRFTPPKLTVKTEEHRAGGMDAPVELDVGMEKLECSIVLSDADAEALKLFGLTAGNFVPMALRGSQETETGETEAVVHTVRGQVKDVDWGDWQPGQKAPCTMMVALRYYKLEIDGETIHEIDVPNMKRIINGVDQLAARRTALGL